MDVELVQSGLAAVNGELNLELQLILRDAFAADRAGCTNPWPVPRPVGTSTRDFAISQCRAGLLAENLLFHWLHLLHSARRACVMRFGGRHATGLDARRQPSRAN